MLFNIEADLGHEIVGYLVPDSFAGTPRLAVVGAGRILWSGPAAEPRPALVASGRHETGICGFRIGPALVPDLGACDDLELRCLASGLTIYRRPPTPHPVPRRVFRLETRLRPLTEFDRAMEPHFQAWHTKIDRLGAESVAQLFLLHGIGSSYASGRLHLPAHPGLADGTVAVIACLRDPFEELAERLLVLSGALGPVARLLPLRDRLALHEAIDALDGRDLTTPRALRRALGRIPAGGLSALANPLTRQLSTAEPGAPSGPEATATALRALAAADLVSLAEIPGHFEAAAAAFLGVPEPARVEPWEAPLLAEMADALARTELARALLEGDLDVYDGVSQAFSGLGSTSQGVAPAGGGLSGAETRNIR